MNPIFDLEPWLHIPHARHRVTCAWPSIPMAIPTKTGAKIRSAMTTGLKTGARTSHRHWSTASVAPLSGRNLHKISIGRRRPSVRTWTSKAGASIEELEARGNRKEITAGEGFISKPD